jgi:hypothetical protein
MPSRTTRKSTRLRASDRSMCCPTEQPSQLASFRPGSTSSLSDKNATGDRTTPDLQQHQRAENQNPMTRPTRGWKPRNPISPSRGRKMSLTSPLIDQAITLIDHRTAANQIRAGRHCGRFLAPNVSRCNRATRVVFRRFPLHQIVRLSFVVNIFVAGRNRHALAYDDLLTVGAMQVSLW